MCSFPLPDFGMTVIYFCKKRTCRLLSWQAFILLSSSGLVNEFLKWVRYRRWPQHRAAFSQSTSGVYGRPGAKHMPPPNTPHWGLGLELTKAQKGCFNAGIQELCLPGKFARRSLRWVSESRRERGELPPVFRELPGKMIVSLFFDKPSFFWFDFIGSNRFIDFWQGDVCGVESQK